MNFGNQSEGRGHLLSYEQVRPLLRWTYAWMVLGLLVTAAVGGYTLSNISLRDLRFNSNIVLFAVIAEFVLVIALSWAMPRLAPSVAALMFLAYSALNGFTLSVIGLVYTSESMLAAFVTTAGLFGAMSVFAFTTNIDLSRFRGILFIGLIGILIAMVVNLFLRSESMMYIISIFGVVIFTGLTAYDTQKIKNMAASQGLDSNPDMVTKLSIYSALILYLDFVNLFLFLLRLMGRRR